MKSLIIEKNIKHFSNNGMKYMKIYSVCKKYLNIEFTLQCLYNKIKYIKKLLMENLCYCDCFIISISITSFYKHAMGFPTTSGKK